MTDDIRLHADLIREGRTRDDVGRLVRDGKLIRLRRGAYTDPGPANPEPTEGHRALIRAAVRQLSPESVVSHSSAAVVHGLPTWPDQLDRIHVTRDRAGGGKRRSRLQVHGMPIDPAEVVIVDGIRITDLGRTVLDLACAGPFERGVAVGDAALRLGVRVGDLEQIIVAAAGRHGGLPPRPMVA